MVKAMLRRLRSSVNSGDPKQHNVKFYTREGCCLCNEAREMLAKLEREFALNITEVDITTDSGIFERFKYAIPVVEFDGEARLGARFSEEDLRHALIDVENSRQGQQP